MNDAVAVIVNAILGKNLDIIGDKLFNICTDYSNSDEFENIQTIANTVDELNNLLNTKYKHQEVTLWNHPNDFNSYLINSLYDYLRDLHPMQLSLAKLVTSKDKKTRKKQLASAQKRMREYLMTQTSYFDEQLNDHFIKRNLLFQANLRTDDPEKLIRKLAKFQLGLIDKKFDYTQFDYLEGLLKNIIKGNDSCSELYNNWLMPQVIKDAFMMCDNFGHFILNHLYMIDYMDVDLFIKYWRAVYDKVFKRAEKINNEVIESVNTTCEQFDTFFTTFKFTEDLVIPEFTSVNQFKISLAKENYKALSTHIRNIVFGQFNSSTIIQVFSEIIDVYAPYEGNILSIIDKHIDKHKTVERNLIKLNIQHLCSVLKI